ncbi:diaminopropionate ammonia-lyase [Oceanobacillus neutriphilus]|uniref:PLP-dependent lyase/thiolase n=1 Tax=Oceanobacillus neutriphilus TaxID=531815 RepID=A0ABQ2P2Y5_9BACI|nr:diaminopropionate ammonia-lyase [Oceanobacillus neutriphilus]GGP16698.1 PLP-dependent lyase/thiolase [Oceanobacillus neutriphilus]
MNMIRSDEIKWVLNKSFLPKYNEQELSYFEEKTIGKVLNFQRTHPKYTKTPLIKLEHLSEYLDVSEIKVKDESYRFGLNAFKVMGGIYAIGKYLAEKLGKDITNLSFKELQSPEVKEQLGEITFISATDGNHGRGVAWAARELGQNAVIYMPKGSTKARLEAIRNEGAFSEITELNYDETVEMCADLAEKKGWVMVQDTAWEGYEEIPLWIMQGYAALAKEIIEEVEEKKEEPPTHIFLQAGVGSFAAGIVSYFMQHYQNNPPKIIVVEPNLADCYYRSFSNENGEMVSVKGQMNSIMAGLCCGVPNNRAFRLLSQYGFASFSCPDNIAALGMRVLGNPIGNDKKIISGESGAVPLGLLYHLRKFASQEISDAIKLDRNSRILVISTEGDTDLESYLDIVWKGLHPND